MVAVLQMASKTHGFSFEDREEHVHRRWEILRLILMALGVFLSWIEAWRLLVPYDFIGITVTVFGGYPIFKEAFYAVKSLKITMESSMVLAIVASTAVGAFFTAAVITFFTVFAEFLEELTVDRGRHALADLIRRKPLKATVRRGTDEQEVTVDQLQKENMVVVKAGERIPVDGTVVVGSALVDQAPITGESVPVEKLAGDDVYAGTINTAGVIEVKTNRVGEDTTFGRIIRLVEEAEQNKAPIQRVADKLATRLIQLAIILAAVTFIVTRDAIATVSVVVVTGACGVAAGTPLAILGSVGRAAKKGIVIKGGKYLEELSRVDTVVVDKTGTLTFGDLQVVEVKAFDSHGAEEVVSLAAVAERHSSHPLAKAVLRKSREMGLAVPTHSDFKDYPGKGVVCKYNDEEILVGNTLLLQEHGVPLSAPVEVSRLEQIGSGRLITLVAHNKQVCGMLCLADVVRDEAKGAIAAMKHMGIRVIMLTGDSALIAQQVAAALQVDDFYAETLPADKVVKIEELLRAGKHVAMVGDGVNDAPALAQSSVGIAMGQTGTDVALESSDIVLMTNDLWRIVDAIRLSRKTYGVITQNFLGTIVIDSVGVLLAFIGVLNPLLAAFVHTFSELIFMLNSSRLATS